MLSGALGGLLALPYLLGSPGGLAALAGLGLLALATSAYAALEPQRPRLERLELAFPGLAAPLDGLRIMQLSDLHLGTAHSTRNLHWALAAVRREQPHLVVFTGDFVSRPEPIADIPQLLRGVTAPLGCYAVFGNHDYWEGPQEIADGLGAVGIELLLNEQRLLHWRGAALVVAGSDDPWGGQVDFAAALGNRPADAFCLLLAHVPEAADEAAAHGVDLQLSGHTHGGHMDLPLLGPLALPRFGSRYERGLHRVGRTTVYTNRGLAGIPLRLGCPPEATIITLRQG